MSLLESQTPVATAVKYRYFNRDMSWLSFNRRVLEEADNREVPLFERVKFLAIYSSNLDEFFRVRVAGIRSLIKVDKKKLRKGVGFDPEKLHDQIISTIQNYILDFNRIYQEILPSLQENNIVIYRSETEALPIHHREIYAYFKSNVLGLLQPVVITSKENMPFLINRAIYFVVELGIKNDTDKRIAILNIPSDQLPRFFELSQVDGKHYFMFLDDVIKFNIKKIFPAYDVLSCCSIKLNRDAELHIEDEYKGNLVEKIKKNLNQRNIGPPSRFLYDSQMPKDVLTTLRDLIGLEQDDMVSGGKYHNFSDFFTLKNPFAPKLQDPKQPPLPHYKLDKFDSLFEAVSQQDFLLHFPYHTYDYVLRFFNEAALDPFVREIKVTVYRIASNSFIANALISAARNGKLVTVFVEVKARFDEENNLRWASEMQKAGVRIIYSLPGLKVHAKVAIVSRVQFGISRDYAYLATGNFNEKTAKIYSDHGLFTANQDICCDLQQVFEYLDDLTDKPKLKHLLVSQVNLQDRYIELIDQEIEHAKAGKEAHLIIKLNHIEDKVMIDKLYQASQAGVKVQMIVRGICCLVPRSRSFSQNITVTRIVDMFLEHSRIFYAANDGKPELYMASADWMNRNLYARIEVGFPIYSPQIRNEVMKFLEFQLRDNTKARFINIKGENVKRSSPTKRKFRAQVDIYNWLKEEQEED
jgi:polyphosphate kinase